MPTPLPTGSWYTWEEIQDWGYESDQDGEPRILLQGTGLYSSLYTVYYLHVDCQVASDGNRVMNLYLTSNWIADLYLPIAGKFDDPVIYRVDGRASPSSRWSYYTNDDIERESWWAPDSVANDIIAALLGNPNRLVITVNPGESYAVENVFNTWGFKVAVRPVLSYCGQ